MKGNENKFIKLKQDKSDYQKNNSRVTPSSYRSRNSEERKNSRYNCYNRFLQGKLHNLLFNIGKIKQK